MMQASLLALLAFAGAPADTAIAADPPILIKSEPSSPAVQTVNRLLRAAQAGEQKAFNPLVTPDAAFADSFAAPEKLTMQRLRARLATCRAASSEDLKFYGATVSLTLICQFEGDKFYAHAASFALAGDKVRSVRFEVMVEASPPSPAWKK